MSTRVIALLTTAAAAAALVLTGCNGVPDLTTGAPSPSGTPAGVAPPAAMPPGSPENPNSGPSASPVPENATEKDGNDPESCKDADCEVTVADGQKITLDKKYGLDPIEVRIEGTRVTFIMEGRHSHMSASLNAARPNAGATFDRVTLRPRIAKDGTVILRVSHS